MVKKKSAKKSSPKRAPARRASAPITRQKETVRVKTFIVEKPVYVERRIERDSPNRSFMRKADEYPAPVFDSEKSPYLKRRAQKALVSKKREAEEEVLGEGGEFDSQGLPEEEVGGEEAAAGEEELAAGEEELPSEGEESLEEGAEAELGGETLDEEYADEEGALNGKMKGHYRSNGLFSNVWWKKAILWAVLIWIIILGVELGMQAMKLIEVDLTRQWWVLLGIMIVLSMIYQKFFSGKIKI